MFKSLLIRIHFELSTSMIKANLFFKFSPAVWTSHLPKHRLSNLSKFQCRSCETRCLRNPHWRPSFSYPGPHNTPYLAQKNSPPHHGRVQAPMLNLYRHSYSLLSQDLLSMSNKMLHHAMLANYQNSIAMSSELEELTGCQETQDGFVHFS